MNVDVAAADVTVATAATDTATDIDTTAATTSGRTRTLEVMVLASSRSQKRKQKGKVSAGQRKTHKKTPASDGASPKGRPTTTTAASRTSLARKRKARWAMSDSSLNVQEEEEDRGESGMPRGEEDMGRRDSDWIDEEDQLLATAQLPPVTPQEPWKDDDPDLQRWLQTIKLHQEFVNEATRRLQERLRRSERGEVRREEEGEGEDDNKEDEAGTSTGQHSRRRKRATAPRSHQDPPR